MNRTEGLIPGSNADDEGAQRRQQDAIDAAKEIKSPRFRAIIRATSGRRKRTGGDIKSFSHEINSKGSRSRYQKLRGKFYSQDVTAVMQTRFTRLKDEVNSELGVLAGDLVVLLEKTAQDHPEWSATIEDLLVVARECAEMSPEDFRNRCEAIVQSLDDRRQELPVGVLKQIHTRTLFILTRCTRLLQFQKEGPSAEDMNALVWHQYSDLSLYRNSAAVVRPGVGLKRSPLALEENESVAESDRPPSRDRISSWKPLPSPSSAERKQRKESKEVGDSHNVASYPSSPVDRFKVALPESAYKIEHARSLPPTKLRELFNDGTGDQLDLYRESAIICRICDLKIPIMHVEEHSRICAIADRCDAKGLAIDERLERVAQVLEKVLEAYNPNPLDTCRGNQEGTRALTSSITEEFFYASSEDYFQSLLSPMDGEEASSDAVNLSIMNELNGFPPLWCKTQSASYADLNVAASSTESMTPQSQLSTPRATQIEVLLAEHSSFSELESFQHIHELLDIVQCMLNIKSNDYSSLECLQSCLHDLQYVIQDRTVDSLVVETLGRRIEKLLQEKYANILRQIDDGIGEPSSTEENGCTEIDSLRGSKPTSTSSKLKDRTTIEDFEIIKPISRGAFGRVFLAKKRVTGDLFAIKVLKKSDMIRKNAVESILAERNILISVCNPFVVRCFYSFTCRENLYLVMEYLNGGDLYSLLRNLGCLNEDIARMYIAEIVLALEYLHSLNIIHRDLKPDNLLIAHDGHMKLTDFGLSIVGLINSTDDLSGPDVSSSVTLGDRGFGASKIQSSQKREQRRKQCVVGTPDYLAPEILLGMPHGKTADWWSVGIILFELLVGIPPFNAEHPQEIFDNIMNRDIPWPLVPEEMSYDARDLINKLLLENPMQRLGATGASEVKQHPFFRSINWGMLAQQKAAFIPATEGDYDTSYFTCRHSWNSIDADINACSGSDDLGDVYSMSCCSSPCSHDRDEEVDECSNLTEFGMSDYIAKYSFSNFSYKNLSQLASINYSLMKRDG